mmetsp:Transcript_23626/g.57244  ORF Transcript_23626/g.57244 Transcript_23626/m.57244 type:complete len:328 (-) Transcript_23626:49-1032(-)
MPHDPQVRLEIELDRLRPDRHPLLVAPAYQEAVERAVNSAEGARKGEVKHAEDDGCDPGVDHLQTLKLGVPRRGALVPVAPGPLFRVIGTAVVIAAAAAAASGGASASATAAALEAQGRPVPEDLRDDVRRRVEGRAERRRREHRPQEQEAGGPAAPLAPRDQGGDAEHGERAGVEVLLGHDAEGLGLVVVLEHFLRGIPGSRQPPPVVGPGEEPLVHELGLEGVRHRQPILGPDQVDAHRIAGDRPRSAPGAAAEPLQHSSTRHHSSDFSLPSSGRPSLLPPFTQHPSSAYTSPVRCASPARSEDLQKGGREGGKDGRKGGEGKGN